MTIKPQNKFSQCFLPPVPKDIVQRGMYVDIMYVRGIPAMLYVH